MMGLRRKTETSAVTLFARPGAADSRLETVSRHGVQLASAAFLLGENQALAIDGGIAQLLVRRLISDSAWDHLDYLVMDLPPGTADIQQFAFALSGRPLCVLVVATPQVIAQQDARRLVARLRQRGARRAGARHRRRRGREHERAGLPGLRPDHPAVPARAPEQERHLGADPAAPPASRSATRRRGTRTRAARS